MAAVIGVPPAGGAAGGVELRRIGISAEPEILDLRDLGPTQPRHDVAGEIEHRMARTLSRLEEADGVRLPRDETIDQVLAALVIGLTDHRAGRRYDPRPFGAELLHRGD